MATIKLRTGSGAPSAASFATAEPAWDATNGLLYIKNSSGAMVQVGAASAPTRTIQSLGSLGATPFASLTPADRYHGIITCTLVGNVDFAFGGTPVATSLLCIFRQDATGNRVITFSSSVVWANGATPILPRAASTFVVIQFVCDGTQWFGWVVAEPPQQLLPPTW